MWPRGLPAHGFRFSEATSVWLRVAALSFGGPAGQIAVMHRILVDEKRWIGESRFLHALNFCMLLPGPEAQQLAIYLGWLLHRTWGGVVAGVLFVLPGFLAILALSLIYVTYGDVGLVEGAFFGLKAAVLAVVLQAVVRIGSRALRSRPAVGGWRRSAIFFRCAVSAHRLRAGLIGYVASRAGRRSSAPAAMAGRVGRVSPTSTRGSEPRCPRTPAATARSGSRRSSSCCGSPRVAFPSALGLTIRSAGGLSASGDRSFSAAPRLLAFAEALPRRPAWAIPSSVGLSRRWKRRARHGGTSRLLAAFRIDPIGSALIGRRCSPALLVISPVSLRRRP